MSAALSSVLSRGQDTRTDLQKNYRADTCFRLDASKFHRGILNSHWTIPIAPQASAGDQKTGESGSQSRSSSRKRCRKRFPKRDI